MPVRTAAGRAPQLPSIRVRSTTAPAERVRDRHARRLLAYGPRRDVHGRLAEPRRRAVDGAALPREGRPAASRMDVLAGPDEPGDAAGESDAGPAPQPRVRRSLALARDHHRGTLGRLARPRAAPRLRDARRARRDLRADHRSAR